MKGFEIDKKILTKAVRESIDMLIKEEMSISSQVVQKSREIEKLILEDYKKTERETLTDGVWKRSGSFKCDVFGYEFDIIYYLYNYRDYDTYDLNAHFYKNVSCTSFERKFMELSILSISGQIQENTFGDTIQHEVEHIYQTVKSGKLLFDDDSLYRKAIDIKSKIAGDDGCNGFLTYLCDVVYYSNNIERDGFVNGLYAQLIKQDFYLDDTYIIKTSQPYKIAAYLNEIGRHLFENFNDENFIKAAKKLGKDRRWYISRCTVGTRKLIKKIMKVAAKAKSDFFKLNENVHWNINFNYMMNKDKIDEIKVNSYYDEG